MSVLFLLAACLCSCASWQKAGGFPSRAQQDIVILASPIRVKPLQARAVVDAIENPKNSAEPTAMIVFKIERVLKGTIPKIKAGGESKWEQTSKAFGDHDYLKLITSDFSNPDLLVDKGWLSVAVADPARTFQISSWENPGTQRYKIRLKPVPERPGSYVLVESQLKG